MTYIPTNYILVTDAASEPVTLSEVKTYLRIDGTDYDNILTPLITTVRQIAENITGRDFINKTWKTYLDSFPTCYREGIQIKKSKLQSITSLKYYTDEVLTLFDSSNYYVSEEDTYSSIFIKDSASWPSIDFRKQAIEIIFVSGYGADATYVPQALKQAMLSHIAYLFENTGDCSDNGTSQFKSLYLTYILPQKLVLAI